MIEQSLVPVESIERAILVLRGDKVLLDADLAALYCVETKALNRAVHRNIERFPADFMFRLTARETAGLRSQIATAKTEKGGRRYIPFVFTEHGVVMAANVLRSERAINISVEIVRAFIKLRNTLTFHKDISREMKEIREFMLKNSLKTDREFRQVWNAIEKLSAQPEKKEERRIGFDLTDASR